MSSIEIISALDDGSAIYFTGDQASVGPSVDGTTDSKNPPPVSGPTISTEQTSTTISVKDTFGFDGGGSVSGTYVFNREDDSFNHATIGFDDHGNAGSFTFALDHSTFSESFSHVFDNGLSATGTFTSADNDTSLRLIISFDF